MKIETVSLSFFLLLGFVSCFVVKGLEIKDADMKINLRWIKGYDEETPKKVELGLQWILSYLGATLPKETAKDVFRWEKKSLLVLDLSKAGFTEKAKIVWFRILKKMKTTEEYTRMGGIDIGRFIMLTFNSSWHYYALTDVPRRLGTFEKVYLLKEQTIEIQRGESCVAYGKRLVQLSAVTKNFLEMGFLASEGKEDIAGKFTRSEFEVFDFMPNGQPRFAIYNAKGELKASGAPQLSDAGKPARCMWCHESIIQKSYIATEDTPHLNLLNQEVAIFNQRLKAERNNLNTTLAYDNRHQHSLGELLYMTFMEPSARRLAAEWDMDIVEIEELLSYKKTHELHEYQSIDFGELYHRKDIEYLTPYQTLQTPASARNFSMYEPDFL